MSRIVRRRSEEGLICEVNMTPLIDVSLVLVVILMVATPLAFQSSIALRTAAPERGAAASPAAPAWVDLAVSSDGTVRVNREVVLRASLGEALRPLIAKSPSGLVVVRCEDGVSNGTFVGVLDAAKLAGADRIAVVGR